MTDHHQTPAPSGPILLCAGTDPTVAAHLAAVAASLLANRPAIVLATWAPPPLTGREALMDALFDADEELRDAARYAALQPARAAADVLDARGVHVTRQLCPEEQPAWREILDAADRFDASVIVAGTSEDAAARPGTLGAQARALAHRARRPVLLVPAHGTPAADDAPALFAYDGSTSSAHAVAAATEILAPRHAIVASVWHEAAHIARAAVVAVPEEVVRKGTAALDEAARLQAAGQADEAATQLTASGWSCDTAAIATARNVSSAIVGAADEQDAAVVVTGTRGRSRIASALLGSDAEAILRGAGRPVLLVAPATS